MHYDLEYVYTVTSSSKGRFSQPLHQKVIQWVIAINGSALKCSLLLQRIKENKETVSKPEGMVDWLLLGRNRRDELIFLDQRALETKIFEWDLVCHLLGFETKLD